jgi:CRP/FNR family cyclic AMP-dependent transcriptional regulator
MGNTQIQHLRLDVPQDLFKILSRSGARLTFEAGTSICAQGDACAGTYYVIDGLVKLTTVSMRGRAAILGFLWAGNFFGESCLAGRGHFPYSAEALARTSVIFIKSRVMKRLISQEPTVAAHFITRLLERNRHIEEDLLGHIFDSSEQRLARTLLWLWQHGKSGKSPSIMEKIDQDTLAAIVGTTRPRVNFFMNKFRKMGLIDYAEGPGIVVNPSLQNFLRNGLSEAD